MLRFTWLMGLAVLLGLGAKAAADENGAKKNILLITESRGFRHGCVNRKVSVSPQADVTKIPKMDGLDIQVSKDGKITASFGGRIPTPEAIEIKEGSRGLVKIEPCVVEKTFMELGAKTGLYNVVCSQDSRKEITAENLKKFDAVFFYTTGELPLSEVQKSDLLAFVRSGKGFGGSHCATDTFYKWKEYGELIGGYFDGHPWHQKINVIVEDPNNPATKHLGKSFEITDEIYQFRSPYSREKLRILLKLDMNSVKNPGKRTDGDNALSWIHSYGKGRVFYTALGHRDEVWRDERFQQHVIGGLRFMLGLDSADVTPSATAK